MSPLDRFGAAVRAAIDRRKRYPPTARLARIEGTTRLELRIDRQGRLLDARVARSSRRRVLDEAALAAAQAVGRYPQAPDALRGDEFRFVVPIVFRLD